MPLDSKRVESSITDRQFAIHFKNAFTCAVAVVGVISSVVPLFSFFNAKTSGDLTSIRCGSFSRKPLADFRRIDLLNSFADPRRRGAFWTFLLFAPSACFSVNTEPFSGGTFSEPEAWVMEERCSAEVGAGPNFSELERVSFCSSDTC